jgi:twin arginine-targeting protein translocase, TatA/E family
MFENLSLPHVLMVIAIALLLFGPKKIPEIAGSMGKGIREFKKSMSEIDAPYEEIRQPSPPARDREAPKRLFDAPPKENITHK